MPEWNEIFQRTFTIHPTKKTYSENIHFDVPEYVKQLRMLCCIKPLSISELSQDAVKNIEFYLGHPSITEKQKAFIYNDLEDLCIKKQTTIPSIIIKDSMNTFRGRWDATFKGWKKISTNQSTGEYKSGEFSKGQWSLHIYINEPVHQTIHYKVIIEASRDIEEDIDEKKYYSIPGSTHDEVNPVWLVGELHEHTTISKGNLDPDSVLTLYNNTGYHFLAISDHDCPPLQELRSEPPIAMVRGQEIELPFGHALLLGTCDWIDPSTQETPGSLNDFIYTVHNQGGLFCVLHPFALKLDSDQVSWKTVDKWDYVDLLEVWPGLWAKRFPEILKTFDLWNDLLNRGHRIYGFCGKGTTLPSSPENLEKIPKTVLMSEGLSETQILSALKQGHFYSTAEPAISLRLESKYGSALMGDELRIPIHETFMLFIDVTQLDRTFIRIHSNKGIYCEMPLSSAHDSQLKFYEKATSDITWYRAEIYRFGRPIDELLAFTNPVFVRGMLSY